MTRLCFDNAVTYCLSPESVQCTQSSFDKVGSHGCALARAACKPQSKHVAYRHVTRSPCLFSLVQASLHAPPVSFSFRRRDEQSNRSWKPPVASSAIHFGCPKVVFWRVPQKPKSHGRAIKKKTPRREKRNAFTPSRVFEDRNIQAGLVLALPVTQPRTLPTTTSHPHY